MTSFKTRYTNAKAKLLDDPKVCPENREVFREFFEWEEYKLQRQNDLRELDEPCFKTLYLYTTRLRIVNRWFENKPWPTLTREDIQRVYDDVEDGRILTLRGKPYQSTGTYYSRVLKGKPFQIAGKAELAREVITFPKRSTRVVRFVTREGFLNLVSVVSNPRHLLLLWLAWDIGENINTLLQLQKKDFVKTKSPESGEPEYMVNLPEAKLKRTRQTRREPTLHPETVRFADMVLAKIEDDDQVFPFGYRQAVKVLHQARKKTGVTCMPNQDPVRWKDLRSGMACHLLSIGWQPHEINMRLGHTPNAPTLNAYINHLAVNRRRPKQKAHESEIEKLREELRRSRAREKLAQVRLTSGSHEDRVVVNEHQMMRSELERTKVRVEEVATQVERFLVAVVGGP